ncbi:rCG63115 [Rattus norvegicus]|uniref:RCG63115 n=1 Tax=Rattus norvegicus TaxID=10116 RepID=A6K368_RAT|nr:rCG63115 [Rattus norvegicus]
MIFRRPQADQVLKRMRGVYGQSLSSFSLREKNLIL